MKIIMRANIDPSVMNWAMPSVTSHNFGLIIFNWRKSCSWSNGKCGSFSWQEGLRDSVSISFIQWVVGNLNDQGMWSVL